MDVTTWEIAIATSVATFVGFLVDMGRRWIGAKIKLRNDLARIEAGLPVEGE